MLKVFQSLFRFLGSFGFACLLLLCLMLLTYVGTMEQVEHGLYLTQKKYFDSWMTTLPMGSIGIPFPGCYLLMILFSVNLIVGGIVRIRKSRNTVGIIITHVGIGLLLMGGLVKRLAATSGMVLLYPGDSSDVYTSFFETEIAISKYSAEGAVTEYVVSDEYYDTLARGETRTFFSSEIPFELRVDRVFNNCMAMPKGPMFEVEVPVVDGYFLQERPRNKQAEANLMGMYVTIRNPADGSDTQGILFEASSFALPVNINGEYWGIKLRGKKYPVPFEVRLKEFHVEWHPGTRRPRSFMSDVFMIDGGVEQEIRIQMNEPLRHKGYTFFQTNWGPQNDPNAKVKFSQFEVVNNPADQWPKWACYVIGLGLLIHFSNKLSKYIRRQARSQAA